MQTFQKELKKKLRKVSKAQRQEILDLRHAGMSIGEICKTLNMELLLVSGVLYAHIDKGCILRKQAR